MVQLSPTPARAAATEHGAEYPHAIIWISAASAYMRIGRGIGVTPTCSSAVYGAP